MIRYLLDSSARWRILRDPALRAASGRGDPQGSVAVDRVRTVPPATTGSAPGIVGRGPDDLRHRSPACGTKAAAAGSDPRQLSSELEGALLTANWYFHLYSDPSYLSRGRRAVRAQLASQATPLACAPCRSARRTGGNNAAGDLASQREQQ